MEEQRYFLLGGLVLVLSLPITWTVYKTCLSCKEKRQQDGQVASPVNFKPGPSGTAKEMPEKKSPLKVFSRKILRRKPPPPPPLPPSVDPHSVTLSQDASTIGISELDNETSVIKLLLKEDKHNDVTVTMKDLENGTVIPETGKYEFVKKLPGIGGRISKEWGNGRTIGDKFGKLLITSCRVTKLCTLKLPKSIPAINKLLSEVSTECEYIHPIKEILYSHEHHSVWTFQLFVSQGSLRDRIYDSPQPDLPWDQKYRIKSQGLPIDKVKRFGRQILEGIIYLYEKGFPPLGHVQSGNVFVHTDGDGNEVCKLGGYENTLLGYKSRFYKRYYKDYLEHIDVLMFGHLVFEMAAGYELVTVSPTEKDYKQFAGNTKILPDLIFIFSQVDIGNCPTIKDIHKRLFFRTDVLSPRHEDTTVPREKDDLLKRLHKKPAGNKPRPSKATKPKPPLPRSHSIASTSTRPPDSDRGLEPKDGGFEGVPLSASSREQSSSLGRLNGETTKMQALKQDMKEFRKDLKSRAKTARTVAKDLGKTAGKAAKDLGNDLRAKLNTTWKTSLKKKELKQSVSLGDLSAAPG